MHPLLPLVAFGSQDRRACLYDRESGEHLENRLDRDHQLPEGATMDYMCFSPDGKSLIYWFFMPDAQGEKVHYLQRLPIGLTEAESRAAEASFRRLIESAGGAKDPGI